MQGVDCKVQNARTSTYRVGITVVADLLTQPSNSHMLMDHKPYQVYDAQPHGDTGRPVVIAVRKCVQDSVPIVAHFERDV
jgi:hypothetical protein